MYLSKLAARKAYLLMVLSLAHVGSKCAEVSARRGWQDWRRQGWSKNGNIAAAAENVKGMPLRCTVEL